MTHLIDQALRGRAPQVPARVPGARVVVAGGAGALGSTLLEQLLALRRFVQVNVLVTRPLGAAVPGLNTVRFVAGQPLALRGVDTAVVVFDRPRHANGREEAFWRPDPSDLPVLAAGLRAAGVQHLLVVVPHAAATLPQALRHGLANLDEQGVATLGFEHLVFMRPARAADDPRSSHPGQRLAHWMLSQLSMMVPQHDRPVRSHKVAQFAAHIAAGLAQSPHGTRVVPAEVVWKAAQTNNLAGLASDWLQGRPVSTSPLPTMRL